MNIKGECSLSSLEDASACHWALSSNIHFPYDLTLKSLLKLMFFLRNLLKESSHFLS